MVVVVVVVGICTKSSVVVVVVVGFGTISTLHGASTHGSGLLHFVTHPAVNLIIIPEIK